MLSEKAARWAANATDEATPIGRGESCASVSRADGQIELTVRTAGVKSFWETMDRWRVFYGLIIIATVLSVPRVHGVMGYTALVISAMVLIVLYSWWRRRGIFRRTT